MKEINLTHTERIDVQCALSGNIERIWKYRSSEYFRNIIKKNVKLIRKIGFLRAK